MDKQPSIDNAVYMIIQDILKHETNHNTAEILCIALLTGFKKVDDLLTIVQQSDNQEKTIETIKVTTEIMTYDEKSPQLF